MEILIYPFLAFAALGFSASLAMHPASLLGRTLFPDNYVLLFFIGLFIVWIPAVILSNRMTRDFKRKDHWKASLRGCPLWMRVGMNVAGAYAFVNFFILASKGNPATFQTRLMTGHMMAFYAAGFSLLYSWIMIRRGDPARCYPNGHPVSASEDFCETCGLPIKG